MRIAILVGTKGRGSNMLSLLEACESGHIPADFALVIAPSESSPAVSAARERRARVAIIDGEDFHERLLQLLRDEKVDLLCLAGYMKLLPSEIVRAMHKRILNIHPALLPKYGGKGMYGMKVHEAVIAAGEKESGCTVHYVDEEYDEGDILLQMKTAVLSNDTAESLAARVLELEHKCYVEAVRLWMEQHSAAK